MPIGAGRAEGSGSKGQLTAVGEAGKRQLTAVRRQWAAVSERRTGYGPLGVYKRYSVTISVNTGDFERQTRYICRYTPSLEVLHGWRPSSRPSLAAGASLGKGKGIDYEDEVLADGQEDEDDSGGTPLWGARVVNP